MMNVNRFEFFNDSGAGPRRLSDFLLELIRRTTSDLPADVEAALRRVAEEPGSRAAMLTQALLDNIALARRLATPICQDTGTLTFFWRVPYGVDTAALEQATRQAVARATEQGLLRQNTIETLTGRALPDNLALGCPVCHFEQQTAEDGDALEVWLLQKGGGCENVGIQYSLPDSALAADRDLDGVRKCLLDAVWRAQGHGCAPGILGVCLGADRAEGYLTAKRQLLRPLTDSAAEPALADLENHVLTQANTLGIGPMGMGGKATLLGVKIAARSRLPASFFVTVSYLCWAARRRGLRVTLDGEPVWLG